MLERKLIYADTVVEKLSELILLDDHEKKVLESFVEKCMAVDAVPAVPVVHGRWLTSEEYANQEHNGWLYCSECEQPMREFYGWGYCPNCGAKMDGDGNGKAD